MKAAKTPSVPALERGLAILDLAARSRNGLTFTQICRHVRFPKSSVHCLLLTLARERYLVRSPTSGRYTCGSSLFNIGRLAIQGTMMREKAATALRALAERTGLTVHLAILEDGAAMLVARAEHAGTRKVATWVGKRIGLHCTSVGKCLLAYLPDAEVERLMKERGLLRYNENTICSLARLKQELADSRGRGWAIDDEEEELGSRCVGVPVFDGTGAVIAAISVSGTVEAVTRENCGALIRHLRRTADEIGASLALEPAESATAANQTGGRAGRIAG